MVKLTKSQRRLMFEAYRRSKMGDNVEKLKPLKRKWLGLGTEAAYRPVIDAGLMTWFDGQIPPQRCMGWLVLTAKGCEVYKEYESEFASIVEAMNKSGYKDSILSQYMLAGGLTSQGGK